MENVKQTLKIMSIGIQVMASLITEWDVPGNWFERGKLVSGLVPKRSVKEMSFFSVVEAQNFADEIRAEFVGLKEDSLTEEWYGPANEPICNGSTD